MKSLSTAAYSFGLLALVTASGAALAQATFSGIGVISGYPTGGASDVSADGEVVVGTYRNQSTHTYRGFRWTRDTGLVVLQPPAGIVSTGANAISADGVAIVGSSEADTFQFNPTPARWVGNGPLDTFLGEDAWGFTQDISNGGNVVTGYVFDGNSSTGFRYIAASDTIQFLQAPVGSFEDRTEAYAVSADGERVVGQSLSRACYWPGASTRPTLIGVLPGDGSSFALGVSHDGTYIVGVSGGSLWRAFLWSQAGGMAPLPSLAANENAGVADVSDDGQTIVGSSFLGSTSRAVMWTPAGVTDLKSYLAANGADVANWQLRSAAAVSADGRTIVGNGINPTGASEGWIATLPSPCPADFDADGFVSGIDYDLYVAAFEAGDLAADFDSDGFITGIDFDLYVAAFEAGC